MNSNNKQIQRIHTLLRACNMQAQKQNLVAGFSNGRCESTKDLTFAEAAQLINYLQQEANKNDAANRMRRKIIAICHSLKWENTNGSVNIETLNKWCLKHSYLKKKLQEYTCAELPKLVSQVQKIYVQALKKQSNGD